MTEDEEFEALEQRLNYKPKEQAMNREDIIRMAREAGFAVDERAQQHQPNCIFHTHHMVDKLLERFAALVAAAAKAEEREACASVCEEQEELRGHTPFDCAAAIRARSKQ